jgi:hypothetical protein
MNSKARRALFRVHIETMSEPYIVSKSLAFYGIDFLFVRAIRTGTTTGASTSLPKRWKLREHDRVNLSYGNAFTRETDLSRNAQTLFN